MYSCTITPFVSETLYISQLGHNILWCGSLSSKFIQLNIILIIDINASLPMYKMPSNNDKLYDVMNIYRILTILCAS